MTREAKIGMLTGLGVIVLIGVLLSEYLGDARGVVPTASVSTATGSTGGSGGATGKMAELPIGNSYRQQVMEPIGVPGMARTDAPLAGLGGGEATMPAMSNDGMPPTAYAAENNTVSRPEVVPIPAGPVVGKPVAAIAVGPAPMAAGPMTGSPPTISVAEPARPAVPPMVADNASPATPGDATGSATAKDSPVKPAVAGKEYAIVAGDNLAKIAKKFYGQSKESDVKRIVAANPTMLKDANSPLIAGKKLIVPNTPVTAKSPVLVATPERAAGAQEADPTKLAKLLSRTTEPVMIYLPGSLQQKSDGIATMEIKAGAAPKSTKSAPAVKEPSKKDPPKIYFVQNGDTLEKIAKKLSPSTASAYAAKLKSLNNVKDPSGLQVGQKLRLPI